MVSERQIHLLQPCNELQQIYKKVCLEKLEDKDLMDAIYRLKKLFNLPLLEQIIDLIELQKKHFIGRLQDIELLVHRDFDAWEEVLKNKNKINAISTESANTFLPGHKTEHKNKKNLQQRYDEIHKSMKFCIKNARGATMSGLEILTLDGYVNSVISTPIYLAWQKENDNYAERLQMIEAIDVVKNFHDVINYSFEVLELDQLKIYCQKVCYHFTEQLTIAQNLATLKIKKITYKYSQTDEMNPKTAKLTFFVNEKKINFSGEAAWILKMLLEQPYQDFELEDFATNATAESFMTAANKKTYDRMYRKFEKINVRIALEKKFIEFGIIDLIVSEGYSVKINPLYAGLIQQYH